MRVVVIGDVMLDEWVHTSLRGRSPEADVPVLNFDRITQAPGGAANVAAGCAALGADTYLYGVVGEDLKGSRLRGACWISGLRGVTLAIDPYRPTTVKRRIMQDGVQTCRIDRESREPIRDRDRAIIVGALREKPSVVVLSDYGKGVATERMCEQVRGYAAGVSWIVDPKGTDWRRYAGATVITPNLVELETFIGRELVTQEDIDAACHSVARQIAVPYLLLTRGAGGMTLYEAISGGDVLIWHFPAENASPVDVTGAGDTVVAALAVALARGDSLPDAARYANHAAGVAVGKAYTATVSQEEMDGARTPVPCD